MYITCIFYSYIKYFAVEDFLLIQITNMFCHIRILFAFLIVYILAEKHIFMYCNCAIEFDPLNHCQ